jgi:hypothetical protein
MGKAAYTCLLVSYRRLSAQFQFSPSAVTLEYLSQCSHPFVASRTATSTLRSRVKIFFLIEWWLQ